MKIILFSLAILCATPSSAAEFVDSVERSFPVRALGRLQITNLRGDIVIQGWPLDKIKIRAKRKVIADTQEEANKLFSAMDFRFHNGGNEIELSAEYGRGLEIRERLKERQNPKSSMEMTISAPAGLKLMAWTSEGKISVKDWRAALDVRTSSGAILLDSIRAAQVTALCPTCEMKIQRLKGALRCTGGSGPIVIGDVKGSPIYVESASGAIQAEQVEGDQLYISKTADIYGKKLKGRMDVHVQRAKVEITDSSGFFSGRNDGGDFVIKMREWQFADKAFIEATKGSIQLALPSGFSGDVDLTSGASAIQSAFSMQTLEGEARGASVIKSPQRWIGRIGEGGELLRIQAGGGIVISKETSGL